MKRNVTKVLSILCLVAVLACAFVPCIQLTGGYQELIAGVTGAAVGVPEESYDLMEQMLETYGVTIDLKATMDSLTTLLEPLNDGQLSIMDFYSLSEGAKNVAEQLSGLPLEGFSILGDESDPVVMAMSSLNDMVITLAQAGQMLGMASSVLLIPVGLFGLLALAVVIRIILRLFNRRGLGVFITILAILNAALMMGIPYGINYAASESFPIGAEYTMVPVVMVVCSIASCIIWAIGRGAKVKKVKEETPVATPTPVAQPVPVEEAATEEAVVDEVLVDTELAEEVVEEEENAE